jgi:adenosylcobinamide-phosphate synthase
MPALMDIILGYAIDLIIGDPSWLYHPVRLIGKFIDFLETILRKIAKTATAQKIAGIILAAVTVGGTYFLLYFLLKYIHQENIYIFHLINIFLVYTVLATKSLSEEALKIYSLLNQGEIEKARQSLSFIVGRDTAHLNEEKITKAVVETVAENASDGIVAPLFYLFLGGAPLAMAYKAVNTLDSMVGYKNERYLYLGWASARLDDIANFIPARLTALLLAVSALLSGSYAAADRALSTMLKEGSHHESLNSGYPEAAMAGALGISLGGVNTYGGLEVAKPVLGTELNPAAPSHILKAVRLMRITSFLALLMGVLLLWLI